MRGQQKGMERLIIKALWLSVKAGQNSWELPGVGGLEAAQTALSKKRGEPTWEKRISCQCQIKLNEIWSTGS